MQNSNRGKNQAGRKRKIAGLPVVRQRVAGIDLGSERHWVCAPAEAGSGREVSDFGATTPELIRMAQWIKARGVESVTMESTGVYWIAPHEVLEAEGLEVVLVDTRQLARVPGRDKKSDPLDCEWIQRLHSCGLLMGSFRPQETVCMLRTLVRDKGNLVAEAADWLRRMQKSLDQMNVRVHRAVSKLDGVTGMSILRAIVGGERDAQKLAKLRDPRCRHSEEEIAEQLSGHWREDHLFSLRQALKMYESIEERIADYEKEILRKLAEMERKECRGQPAPPVKNPKKRQAIQRRGEEAMRQALYRMSGVDLTGIDAIGVETVQVVISEYGPDLEPLSHRETIHQTCNPGAAPADERGQAGKKEKAQQREHSGGRGAADGRHLTAAQRYGPGRILSPDRATDRSGCGRIRRRPETRDDHLPDAAVGKAIRG